MTLEDKRKCPDNIADAIIFVRDRMLSFWEEARLQARFADAISEVIRKKNRGRFTAREYHPSLGFAEVAKNSEWQDAVAAQQMYDRWTMREAAVLQALCALEARLPLLKYPPRRIE